MKLVFGTYLIGKATAEVGFMLMPLREITEGSNQLEKVSDAKTCLMTI
jgi:hypothetical protein